MSISQNFPEEGPTLNLNFAGSRILDPRITFSRSQTTSNGSSYMDENGLIRYAGPDEPRFDHRYVNGEVESLGLLIEEQRINQQKRSENFTIASGFWNEVADGVSVTSDQVIAPDGNMTADKVAIKTSGGGSKGIQGSIITSQENRQYTVSVFAKADDHSNIKVEFQGGGKTVGIYVDLLIGNTIGVQGVPDDYDVIPYPNGWYRIYVTNTAAATAGAALRIYLTSGTTHQFTGTPENGVYLWGAQLEVGSFPTSYIPTEGSTKTRNHDRAYYENVDQTDWFNKTEGTLVFEHTDVPFSSSTSPGYPAIGFGRTSDGNSQLSIQYFFTKNNQTSQYLVRTQISGDSANISINGFGNDGGKVGFVYKENDYALVKNGSVIGSDNSGAVPDPYMLIFGMNGIGIPENNMNAHIKNLQYYPTRLSNSQLVALTR